MLSLPYICPLLDDFGMELSGGGDKASGIGEGGESQRPWADAASNRLSVREWSAFLELFPERLGPCCVDIGGSKPFFLFEEDNTKGPAVFTGRGGELGELKASPKSPKSSLEVFIAGA